MFNFNGDIIGIVSHILSKSGGSNGLGLVVSVDTIRHIIDSSLGAFSGFIWLLLNKKPSYAINNMAGHSMLIQHVILSILVDKPGFKGVILSIVIGRSPILFTSNILLEVGVVLLLIWPQRCKLRNILLALKKAIGLPTNIYVMAK
ncbi:MAG: serine protease Do [Flavobacteriales bacterium]|jgi:serine protease Do